MNNENIRILGVLIQNIDNQAFLVQQVLTKFGCTIKTRLGLHNENDNDSVGLMILELTGDDSEMDKLELELKNLANVEVQKMIFDF